jgi:hypothetical protein
MRGLLVRFAVALLTFVVGVVSASLWVAQYHRPVEKMPTIRAIVIPLKPNHPEGWQKLDVFNKVSFYLPPDMKEMKMLGNIDFIGSTKSFENKTTGVTYSYIVKEVNEKLSRKITCEYATYGLSREPSYRSSEVRIGGKAAAQYSYQFDDSKLKHMNLCFPDIGDGSLFTLSAIYEDEQNAGVVKQIFDSIEFPSQAVDR